MGAVIRLDEYRELAMGDEEQKRKWREGQWDLFLQDQMRLRARGITLDVAIEKIVDLNKDFDVHATRDENFQAEIARELGVVARDLADLRRHVDRHESRLERTEEKLESGEEKLERLSEKSGQWELDILEKERDAALAKANELQRAIESRNSKRPSDPVESKRFWFDVVKWIAGGMSAILVQAGLLKAAWEVGARLFGHR